MKKQRASRRITSLRICSAALALAFPQLLHAEPQVATTAHMRAAPPPVSPERFLADIYRHFARPDSDSVNTSLPTNVTISPWQLASRYFTADTLAVIGAHQALLTEVGVVDGDPFCGCQDWTHIEVDVVLTKRVSRKRSDATVIFHDVDEKRREVAYRLVLTGKGWRVADMTLLGTSPDGWLVAVLKAETAELHRRSNQGAGLKSKVQQ